MMTFLVWPGRHLRARDVSWTKSTGDLAKHSAPPFHACRSRCPGESRLARRNLMSLKSLGSRPFARSGRFQHPVPSQCLLVLTLRRGLLQKPWGGGGGRGTGGSSPLFLGRSRVLLHSVGLLRLPCLFALAGRFWRLSCGEHETHCNRSCLGGAALSLGVL